MTCVWIVFFFYIARLTSTEFQRYSYEQVEHDNPLYRIAQKSDECQQECHVCLFNVVRTMVTKTTINGNTVCVVNLYHFGLGRTRLIE